MRCREVVEYHYLDADNEGDSHYHEHSLLVWEAASPIGLLLMSNIDNTLQVIKVKDRTVATIEAVRLYDFWQKVVKADRRRSESIATAISNLDPKIEFIRCADDKFKVAKAEDNRSWRTIDEAICSLSNLSTKLLNIHEFITEETYTRNYCWNHQDLRKAIESCDYNNSIGGSSRYRVVDRLGSVIYGGV